ncbi:DNA translocase FtsK [Marinobacterium rhizophilum]|uniref:DNA translocase FtsK n=1 Tax=Marinobacterium rhizophilum TaxID=420402 RepID=A0ABY5HLE4_9GAMM|nr:DNA translocase FtsK [Marinobacterium rhizophilum]UTW13201.1 DNA translocase FtsK 4TM domain-containing protein [Marinobacterium rhizophilum]
MSEQNLKASLSFAELLVRIAKESALMLVLGVCLYLMIAVLGYDSRDPGWSHLGYHPEVRNLAGTTGAWVADWLFSFVGVGAWLVPLLMLYPSLRFLVRRKVSLLDGMPYLILRATGALVFVAGLCALASLHISNSLFEYPFTSGGLIGQALSDWVVSWFSVLGGSVVLWTLMLVGLTCYVEVSVGQALESIGRALLSAFSRLRGLGRLPVRRTSRSGSAEVPDTATARAKEYSSSVSSARVRTEPAHRGTPLSEEQAPLFLTPEFTGGDSPLSPAETGVTRTVAPPERVEPSFAFAGDERAANPVAAQVANDESSVALSQVADATASGLGDAAAGRLAPAADSAVAVTEEAVRKGVRIVPLAEAHKPMQDSDLGLEHEARSGVRTVRQQVPSLDLLDPPELHQEQGYTDDQLEMMSRLLEDKLKDFGVVAEVVEVNPGPVITRFELQPAPGVKASKITNLAKDLARSMAVLSVRVVEVIPGKSVVGIEIPNESRQTVRLSEVLNSKPYREASSKLTLGLGNDIAGNPVVVNLAKMPHLLVAGTTGSGKSVGVNAMLLSLLFKATPDEVRLMMVDPKMLELSIYEGIPHLLTPVITDMKEAAGGLRWCVAEMERRYKLMAKMGVRNLAGFNEKLLNAREQGQAIKDPLWNPEQEGLPFDTPAPELDTLPYIVVVIDEFADMMMIVGKKVEELIARIAQKARAAGIHLILATQRPSVDVITGLIKANVPTRIAFQVSSKIDSRTILDQSGAENLLGNGDMLYLPAGVSVPNRVHGAFVSDDEVHRIVEAWKLYGAPEYIDDILTDPSEGGAPSAGLFDDEQDALYDEAVAFVLESRKASISSVQRKLKIGYNRAARMIETMEAAGVVTPAGSNGQREVLAPPPPRD